MLIQRIGDLNNVGEPVRHGTCDDAGIRFYNTYSLQFDGVDEFVDCGNGASLSPEYNTPFTLSVVYRYPGGGGTYQTLTGKRRGAAGNRRGYSMLLRADLIRLYCALTSVSSTAEILVRYDNALIFDGNWHHLAFTYDGSGNANGVSVYFDGAPVVSTIQTNSLGTNTIVHNEPFQIGCSGDSGSEERHFVGDINCTSLIDGELAAAQIAEMWTSSKRQNLQATTMRGSLRGWWQMGNYRYSFPTVPDDSGNGNNGTMNNMEVADRITAAP